MSETSPARAARRGRAAATRGGGQESGGSRGALNRSPCGGGVGGWSTIPCGCQRIGHRCCWALQGNGCPRGACCRVGVVATTATPCGRSRPWHFVSPAAQGSHQPDGDRGLVGGQDHLHLRCRGQWRRRGRKIRRELPGPGEGHLHDLSVHVLLARRHERRPVLQPAEPHHGARRSKVEGRCDEGGRIRSISEVMLGEQRNIRGCTFRSCLTL